MDKKLRELLENVPNAYDDFVLGISECCKTDDERQKIIDYINENPDTTTSKVIEYFSDEILATR